MTETKNNPETTSQSNLTNTPNTNEEILALLRKLVDQKSSADEQEEPNIEDASSSDDVENDDEDEDNEKTAAPGTIDAEEDDCYTDSDLETVGYIVGGAALVGAGALLYHLLRKL